MSISIHVPRVEDDPNALTVSGSLLPFQSTSPVWRTTDELNIIGSSSKDFNPRPPCGGRLIPQIKQKCNSLFQSTSPVWRTTDTKVYYGFAEAISIHVPRVEDDYRTASFYNYKKNISIHVPRVEDDYVLVKVCRNFPYFNPRPPCGGRRT